VRGAGGRDWSPVPGGQQVVGEEDSDGIVVDVSHPVRLRRISDAPGQDFVGGSPAGQATANVQKLGDPLTCEPAHDAFAEGPVGLDVGGETGTDGFCLLGEGPVGAEG
jgi:hypothetical protein